MGVNDDADLLHTRGVLAFLASVLAPTDIGYRYRKTRAKPVTSGVGFHA